MTDELIKRLHSIWIGPGSKQAACEEAVVLIEQQSARIAELEASLQASRRAALEEAAAEITKGISQVKENGWTDCANERLRCADAIRALSGPTET